VERGSALSVALARHPKAFSRLYVAMVRSGETGGSLDSVLLRLASTIEKQVELRRKVKSAMTYPAVVAVLAWLGGRESRSQIVRQILWIFAASQLLAVIGVILAWIVKWAVIMAVVIFAVLGLVYLFLDRR